MINDPKVIAEVLNNLDKVTPEQLNKAIESANREFMNDEEMLYILNNWSLIDLHDSENYEVFKTAILCIIYKYHEEKTKNKLLQEELDDKDKIIDKMIENITRKDKSAEKEER